MLVYSCKKELFTEELKTNAKELTVAELQKALGAGLKVGKGNSTSATSILRTPNWLKAYSLKLKDGSNVLSVPLSKHENDAKNGVQNKLVAYKDSTGKIQSAIMVVRPNSAYLLANKGNVKLKTFTGDILFFSTTNVFLRGYVLDKGKISGGLFYKKQLPNNSVIETQGWEKECITIDGGTFIDENGYVGVIVKQMCMYTFKSSDPYLPAEEQTDWIQPNFETYCWFEEEEAARTITRDTSVANNPKINCLMDKLLGTSSNSGNTQFTSLLTAFTGKGFDLIFKLGSLTGSDKGQTTYNPYSPTDYSIIIDRNFVNTETKINVVKTLLHEAFHANLMQKSYEMFGNAEVGLWAIGPKDLSLQELMDKIENVIQTNHPTLAQTHHEFMAQNISIIKNGLMSFALTNDTNYSDFTDDDFTALAYEGLHTTSYYLNKVVKDSNGNPIMVSYSGGVYTLAAVHTNRAENVKTGSVIPCN